MSAALGMAGSTSSTSKAKRESISILPSSLRPQATHLSRFVGALWVGIASSLHSLRRNWTIRNADYGNGL
ncbi:hypothetical protein PM082_021497 [Marasmius tenuissimus]|nr:hypothetical protein PM082_021497 [Marasmius tenuissimus]